MAQYDKAPTEAFLLLRKQLNARLREEFARENWTQPVPMPEKAMPDPLTQKAQARKDALAREEEKFREARMEYETTGASILAVARSHNLKYEDLRLHIRMYHPESNLLHIYARQSAEVTATVQRQISEIQRLGEGILRRMSEELSAELAKLGKKSS